MLTSSRSGCDWVSLGPDDPALKDVAFISSRESPNSSHRSRNSDANSLTVSLRIISMGLRPSEPLLQVSRGGRGEENLADGDEEGKGVMPEMQREELSRCLSRICPVLFALPSKPLLQVSRGGGDVGELPWESNGSPLLLPRDEEGCDFNGVGQVEWRLIAEELVLP